MKILIQRVTKASVEVNKEVVGSIDHGVLVFIGIAENDTKEQSTLLANKLVNLRIFSRDQGKINHSLLDEKGSALIISQFTLYADCDKGRRPSFIKAAPPIIANELYLHFTNEVKNLGVKVAAGIFGAEMKVSLINDGPFTIMLEQD